MFIGQVSQRSGVPAHTIRFYEQQRLVTRAARSPSGYRVYSEQALSELEFIKQAQRLGFSLDEVREILNIGRGGRKPCARVAALCTAHLDDIDRRMAELRAFRRQLQRAQTMAQDECGFTSAGFCRAIMGADGQRAR